MINPQTQADIADLRDVLVKAHRQAAAALTTF